MLEQTIVSREYEHFVEEGKDLFATFDFLRFGVLSENGGALPDLAFKFITDVFEGVNVVHSLSASLILSKQFLFDHLPLLQSNHFIVLFLDLARQSFEVLVSGDEDLLKYGEIEFDAASVKHFYLDWLLVFHWFKGLEIFLLLVLGQCEIDYFNLLVLTKTEKFKEPEEDFNRNETVVSGDELNEVGVGAVVYLLLDEVNFENVKDQRMQFYYLILFAYHLNPLYGSTFAALFAVSFNLADRY